MGILIKNGEIVTASERVRRRRLLRRTARSSRSAPDLEKRAADGRGDRRLGAVRASRASSTRTCTWSCRSWARCRADDFETGTAVGRRRRHHHASSTSCIPDRGQSLLEALATWREQGEEGRSPTTASTWRSPAGATSTAEEMRDVVAASTASPSFKVFMAYKGAHHGRRRRALPGHEARRRSSARWSPCTPRTATRCARAAAGAARGQGDTRPRVPPACRARAASRARPRPRADDGAAARRHRLHRAHDLPRGGRGAGARQARGPALLRRDLPAVPAARRHACSTSPTSRARPTS